MRHSRFLPPLSQRVRTTSGARRKCMPTYGPLWKSLQSSSLPKNDDEDVSLVSPCKRLTSTERVLSDYGGRRILGDALALGDVVHYEGNYDWFGRIVKLTQSYGTLLDCRARLSRVVLESGEFVLLGRWYGAQWSGTPAALSYAARTAFLVRMAGIAEAISAIQDAPFDPADFDRWLIPL